MITGNGPPRSGRVMEVLVLPSLVGDSFVPGAEYDCKETAA
jgi:hypothetical protein